MNNTVRVSFHGAAGTVTGSKYLVETGSSKFLVDCGLFQGSKELRLRNWADPTFPIRELDAIVLTHAHIDHTGYLPLVVRRGYRGPIYATEATIELVKLLLPDSAYLQEEEAFYANKHGTSKHFPAKPLYTVEDAEATLKLLRPMPKDSPFKLLPDVTVIASVAGHILGAVTLTIDTSGKRLTFSGDIGRYDVPILPDPKSVDIGNLLICESTYGDKFHSDADVKLELAAVIKQALTKNGALLIPAFALGRTQILLYYISELERSGLIPELPVFVDSPMAVDATEIHRKFRHDFDDDAKTIIKSGDNPLHTARTYYCHSVDESKQLNSKSGTHIIIAASGMCTGGRITHHLSRLLPDESTTVLFVGYQAEGSRGQIIQSGAEEVKIFGRYVPIRAQVKTISSLSAHGDQTELHRWLKSSTGTPSIVRIVHGEAIPAKTFSETLVSQFHWNSKVAEHLEVVEI